MKNSRIWSLLVVLLSMMVASCVPAAIPVPTVMPVPVLLKVSVQLGWQNNGEFAAVHNAIAEGYYMQEGLEVVIKTGGSGIDPIPIVANRNENFGISAGTAQMIAAIANGKIPIKAVAALGQVIPSGYMYYLRPGEQPGQRTPKDWRGAIVCVQKPGFISARLIAKMVGVAETEFTLTESGDAPDLLQAGKCDYFNGWATNQGFVLDKDPSKPWSMIYASDYVPAYPDVIFARNDYIEKNPDVVRRFVRATMRGLQFQIDNPSKTVENVLRYGQEGLSKDQLVWRMGKQNPLAFSADTNLNGLGYMDPKKWEDLASNMVGTGEIKQSPNVVDMMTNDYLKEFSYTRRVAVSVRIDRVTHWFGDLQVLHDITLDVAEGEFVALLGCSSCGKTTLLNVIADLIKPMGGSVRINGDSAETARRKRRIGYIFQTPALLKNRTAFGNVLLPMEIAGMNRRRAADKAKAMLSLVGLQGFENYLPGQLSGGMRQRVAIARVFACDYQLILADEPFASLDALTKRAMAEELLRVWQTAGRRSTVIFVTHDEQEAAFLADRIVFMSRGPGRVQDIIPVGFARPRALALRKTPEFFRLTSSLLDLYAKDGQDEEQW